MPFKPELLRYKHVVGAYSGSVFINFGETGEKRHWSKTVSVEISSTPFSGRGSIIYIFSLVDKNISNKHAVNKNNNV